jgi:thiamine biosynthesis protein ThiS
MQLFIQKDRARIMLKYSGTVKELLERINVNPETVMVSVNGKLVAADAKVEDTDKVEVLQVVSGG